MKYLSTLMGAAAMAGAGFAASSATMSVEPYLGEIQQFGGSYCPNGWAPTNGQMLPISEFQALFSLLGTNYGGDGRTVFGVPDLRGRVSVGVGQGPGLTGFNRGEKFGAESVTLEIENLAAHTHTATLQAQDAQGMVDNPTNALLADFPDGQTIYAEGPADVTMHPDAVFLEETGGNLPFNIYQPSMAMTTCIAVQGQYPPRN